MALGASSSEHTASHIIREKGGFKLVAQRGFRFRTMVGAHLPCCSRELQEIPNIHEEAVVRSKHLEEKLLFGDARV